MRSMILAVCLATGALLVACGGGGSGGSGAGGGTSADNTAFNSLNLSNTYTGSWQGRSGGYGGDGSSGSTDTGGGAGDGEFVKLSGSFPTGAGSSVLTWTVLRSQYGQQGATGTITVTPANQTSAGGGYLVTHTNGVASARAGQANIYVSTDGQVSGTLPLTINGSVKDTVFHTIRFNDAATGSSSTDFSAIAGTYGWGMLTADISTGSNRNVQAGVVLFNAAGTGRICPGTETYASNCTNGMDVVLSYPDSANKSLIRVNAASTQAAVTVGGASVNKLDLLLVAKSTFSGTGVAVTGDYLAWSSSCSSCAQRSGAVYMSRLKDGSGTAFSTYGLPQAEGIWNATVNYQNSATAGGTMMVTVETVSGATKFQTAATNSTTCDTNAANTLVASLPTAGGLGVHFKDSSNNIVAYGFVMDQSTAVYVEPGDTLGILRLKAANATSGYGYCTPL